MAYVHFKQNARCKNIHGHLNFNKTFNTFIHSISKSTHVPASSGHILLIQSGPWVRVSLPTEASGDWKTDSKLVFQGIRGDPGELITSGPSWPWSHIGKRLHTLFTIWFLTSLFSQWRSRFSSQPSTLYQSCLDKASDMHSLLLLLLLPGRLTSFGTFWVAFWLWRCALREQRSWPNQMFLWYRAVSAMNVTNC